MAERLNHGQAPTLHGQPAPYIWQRTDIDSLRERLNAYHGDRSHPLHTHSAGQGRGGSNMVDQSETLLDIPSYEDLCQRMATIKA